MIEADKNNPYCIDLFKRKRIPTIEVRIGALKIGSCNPIALQSMTTTDTMDTKKTVDQSIRMIQAGCELVRITAPSIKEAKNLSVIKKKLRNQGYNTPLVADIHFTPNAAEIAAKTVEKVRVNPGNYADKKSFKEFEYSDDSYQKELERVEEKFTPLVLICKENNTAIRIGTNHGSLSDRIMSRFGDTPEGMVESAMEFIRICEKNNYYNLVISMKASNTLIMVQAYRLLASTMITNDKVYPLHLGVTEAGDGEDGRIKSAVGIGALLEDGLGDTIRVSLTEAPENEIPIAKKLVEKFNNQSNIFTIPTTHIAIPYSPYRYAKRHSNHVVNIGGKNVPVVVADLSAKMKIIPANFYGFGYNYSIQLDKWNLQDQAADYVYIGENQLEFDLPGTLGVICELINWQKNYSDKKGFYPIIQIEQINDIDSNKLVFVIIDPSKENDYTLLHNSPKAVLVLKTDFSNKVHLYRYLSFIFADLKIYNPVILQYTNDNTDADTFQLNVSSESGISFIDGFGDGLWIKGKQPQTLINSTSFGILQATRTRISKTEYISCPSCGRTLFDLEEITAKIRKETSHLKGIKIAIMGCIVNGPGEMADADYGYVGTGIGKIHLYKEKNIIKKNVPEEEAVQELINLIKENDDWVDLK